MAIRALEANLRNLLSREGFRIALQVEIAKSHTCRHVVIPRKSNKSPLPTGICPTVSPQPPRLRPAAGLKRWLKRRL
jgi:diadenosine tetraphosphate (Ap4A) HIT family hydrolase